MLARLALQYPMARVAAVSATLFVSVASAQPVPSVAEIVISTFNVEENKDWAPEVNAKRMRLLGQRFEASSGGSGVWGLIGLQEMLASRVSNGALKKGHHLVAKNLPCGPAGEMMDASSCFRNGLTLP